MFGLLDCNHFYAAVQRAFDPSLDGRPVVVLSNNDGNIVSLTDESKALGLRRGDPYFQIRGILQQHGGRAFSSNYPLYGSMSERVSLFLASQVPEIEVYSIDECFLNLHGMQRWLEPDLVAFAQRLRAGVLKRTHIPTCIGIAPTKTLAKVANRLAKKRPELQGVLCLDTPARRQWALAQLPAEDVWGVGGRYAQLLAGHGIATAAELAAVPESWARKHLGGIVGVRLVRELQGHSCLGIMPSEDGTLARRSICHSRSFGRPLRAQADVLGAVAAFTSRVAEKLRRQQDGARLLTVFLSRSRFDGSPPPYSASAVVALPMATSDTLALVRVARQLVQQLWRPGTAYTKAGVVLDGMEPAGQQQLTLFAQSAKLPEHPRLMQCLDQLNARYGANTVQVATCASQPGQPRPWLGKSAMCSPAYTTRFEELLTVRS